jgi:hypothetical protein
MWSLDRTLDSGSSLNKSRPDLTRILFRSVLDERNHHAAFIATGRVSNLSIRFHVASGEMD